MKDWQEILSKFAAVQVLIVGDVMLDRYWWGTVSRVSPEAPVPVVKLERVTATAGGAANVAANAASLGAQSFLVGAIGNDESGRSLPAVLEQCNVSAANLVTLENRPTTTKTRIVAHQQHVVRIDDENALPLDHEQAAAVWQKINELLPEIDVVILSDYAKGCLCDHVLTNTIETAKRLNKPVLIDPKGTNYKKYAGATLLTPNKSEAAAASGIEIVDEQSCRAAGEKLLDEARLDSLLITLGEDGMRLFERNRDSQQFPAVARKVYDVTGAGDTVIATLALALGAKADLATAARLANVAAGIAVEQVGTTAVAVAALRDALTGER